MKIVNKKTTELTIHEIQQICECFNYVFDKQSKTISSFNNQFLSTCLGYSLHTMLVSEDEQIVGLYAVIPFEYIYKRDLHLFGVGVDFMIRKEHRDNFKNVLSLCRESMKYARDNGLSCILAFPNNLSYQLNTRILRMKDVGKLNTYILPYKLGDVKPILRFANIFSKLLCRILLTFSRLDWRNNGIDPIIHRYRESFDTTRYQWFDPHEYRVYKDSTFSCKWKISNFDGIKAAFLIDVYPMTSIYFNKSVKKMFDAEKGNVGLFIYVGCLPFMPVSMVKIPQKYAPKKFNFVAQILNPKDIDANDIYNINNWDVNLSTYDLL